MGNFGEEMHFKKKSQIKLQKLKIMTSGRRVNSVILSTDPRADKMAVGMVACYKT